MPREFAAAAIRRGFMKKLIALAAVAFVLAAGTVVVLGIQVLRLPGGEVPGPEVWRVGSAAT
jgi:hypothetical protein